MDKLGHILVKARVVTPDELERAINVQSRRGGRLGRVLIELGIATNEAIVQAWSESVITPSLVAEIDRHSTNHFTMHPRHGIDYVCVHKLDTIVEDMLDECAIVSSDVVYHGTCTLRMGDAVSPPIEFELDASTNFASLLDAGPAIARRWVDLVCRGVAKDAA